MTNPFTDDITAGPGPRGVHVVALGRKDPRLILDVSGVSSCDEAAVRVIEEATARAWRRGPLSGAR